jgi:preprotein translocase subunit YajC
VHVLLQEWLHGMVAQTAAPADGPGPLAMAVPYLLIFVALYFIMIRPQQKQQQEKDRFLAQLKKGDDVVLQSGFFAKIVAVGEADVTVDLAANVRVKVLKSAVVGPAKAGADAKADAEKAEKAEKADKPEKADKKD